MRTNYISLWEILITFDNPEQESECAVQWFHMIIGVIIKYNKSAILECIMIFHLSHATEGINWTEGSSMKN